MDAPLEGTLQSEAWVTDMRPGGRHFLKKITISDYMLQAMAVAE